MGYRVKDEVEISLFVNGVEYPLSNTNLLNSFHCAESTKYKAPTFHLTVLDEMKMMSSLQLGDASPISVIIKDSGMQETMNFRVGTWAKHPSGGQDLYEIDGFINAPRYRIGTSSLGLRGTSHEVLAEICAATGLAYSGVQTNDSQIWLPRNKTFCTFANCIAAHGFLTEQSHLVMGVDLSGTMRYRDVRAPGVTAKVTHGYEAEGAVHCIEFRPIADSGVTNSISGYRNTRIAQSIYGLNVHDALGVTSRAGKILVNASVREEIKRGNHSYGPIDFGNVHDNFQRAEYQNARFDALRSLGGEFLFNHPTKLRILDSISLTTNANTPSEYDGVYVIGHKVIYVEGNSYAEKFVAYKESMN